VDPLCECGLGHISACQVHEDRYDLRFRSLDSVPVQAQEYCHDEEGYALVSISVRMVPYETESVRCGEYCKIAGSTVDPPVSRARKGRFQSVFIP